MIHTILATKEGAAHIMVATTEYRRKRKGPEDVKQLLQLRVTRKEGLPSGHFSCIKKLWTSQWGKRFQYKYKIIWIHHLLIKRSKDNILSLSTMCYLVGHKLNDVDSLDCGGTTLNSLYSWTCICYCIWLHILYTYNASSFQHQGIVHGILIKGWKRRIGLPKMHPTDHISTPVE